MEPTLGIADNDRDGPGYHRRRIVIAEPHGAPSPWAERTIDHRKVSNRRV
jgi:hypothetical protein